MTEKLNKIFNLPSTPPKVVEAEIIEPTKEEPKSKIESELEDDFQAARENIKELILKGDEALDGIMDVAKLGEHPRAYEVAGQLIKTLIDANKDLIKIHQDARPGTGKQSPEAPQTVHNTVVFNGTTKDLAELVKKNKTEN